MARLKPNKSLKSPNKQQNEKQKKTKKTNNTQSVTPHTTKTIKKTTGTEETNKQTNKHRKEIYLKENTNETQKTYLTTNRKLSINKSTERIVRPNKDGDIVNSKDDNVQQPSDEDAQGNVLTAEEQTLIMMNNSH
jgi:hypothetical protein